MRTVSHVAAVLAFSLCAGLACAGETLFFDASQVSISVGTGATSETIESEGYRFTYTADKYWASGGGPPTGRFFSVFWPDGVQAQAVTAGPKPGPATITLKRADGEVFDLTDLRFKLLANTAGAGAALEIMPLLGGEDGLPDPVMLNASGYGGQSFSYSPNLVGYDTYKMTLYVDFAVTGLTLVDAVPEPATIGLMLPLAALRRRRAGR